MTINLRERSRMASAAIKSVADNIHEAILDQLSAIETALPDSFEALSPSDRQAFVEELRAGLIVWSTKIDPVAAQLRSVLRQSQDELSKSTYEMRDVPTMDEEDMPWTQTFRDRYPSA